MDEVFACPYLGLDELAIVAQHCNFDTRRALACTCRKLRYLMDDAAQIIDAGAVLLAAREDSVWLVRRTMANAPNHYSLCGAFVLAAMTGRDNATAVLASIDPEYAQFRPDILSLRNAWIATHKDLSKNCPITSGSYGPLTRVFILYFLGTLENPEDTADSDFRNIVGAFDGKYAPQPGGERYVSNCWANRMQPTNIGPIRETIVEHISLTRDYVFAQTIADLPFHSAMYGLKMFDRFVPRAAELECLYEEFGRDPPSAREVRAAAADQSSRADTANRCWFFTPNFAQCAATQTVSHHFCRRHRRYGEWLTFDIFIADDGSSTSPAKSPASLAGSAIRARVFDGKPRGVLISTNNDSIALWRNENGAIRGSVSSCARPIMLVTYCGWGQKRTNSYTT